MPNITIDETGLASFFCPIKKIDEEKRLVWGYASTDDVDSVGDVITLGALKDALPDYMSYPALRYMHQLHAAGSTKEAVVDDKGLYICAYVSDNDVWRKVKDQTLRGFSVGGNPKAYEDASKKKITKLELCEISLVDVPCNRKCRVEVFKASDPNAVFGASLVKSADAGIVDDVTEKIEANRAKLIKAVEALDETALEAAVEAFEKHTASDAEVKKTAVIEPEIAKSDKEKAKGDYGDVPYADPGYQDDKKARFPIGNESHVKAAWSYISKSKNAEKYSSEQLSHIKSEIIAAWKAHIDKDGPPSADKKAAAPITTTEDKPVVSKALEQLGKSDASESFVKGLCTVTSAIYLLETLGDIQEKLRIEAAVEGDNSQLPVRFGEVLRMVAALVQELLSEEVSEMLEDGGDDYDTSSDMMIMYAAKLHACKVVGEGLSKAIGDKTGSKNFSKLSDIADALTKAGSPEGPYYWPDHGDTFAWNDIVKPPIADTTGENNSWGAKNIEKAQKLHDAAISLGATCKSAEPTKEKTMDGDKTEDVKTKDAPVTETKADEKEMKDDKDKKDEGKEKAAETTETKADEKDMKDTKDEKDKKKKSAEVETPDAAAILVAKAVSILADQITDLRNEMLSSRRNPPAPATPVTKTVVAEKGNDIDPNNPALEKAADENDPQEVLKKVFSAPNYVNLRENGR